MGGTNSLLHLVLLFLFKLNATFQTHDESFNFDPPVPLFYCNPASEECYQKEKPSLVRKSMNISQKEEDLAVCSLNCARDGVLWPKPTGIIKLGRLKLSIDIKRIWLSEVTWEENILDIFDLFIKKLQRFVPEKQDTDPDTEPDLRNGNGVAIKLAVDGADFIQKENYNHNQLNQKVRDRKLKNPLEIDETYTLKISKCVQLEDKALQVQITGKSVFGLRHGLETLLQLIAYSEHDKLLYILCDSLIEDRPTFPYRGISIDVARRFYPLSSLKRLLDGMSHSKLNYLHLHFTDAQSFPVQFDAHPELAYFGAYGPDKVYRKRDLKELNEYANLRGVTIVPEVDSPSHVGAGWDRGNEMGYGKLVLCYPGLTQLGPPWGNLNPLNPNVHIILQNIFKELLIIFGRDDTKNFFHIGGDEVWMGCWMEEPHIKDWVKNQQTLLLQRDPNITVPSQQHYLQSLWEDFEINVLKSVRKSNNNLSPNSILWTSKLTQQENFPKNLKLSPGSKIIVEDWGRFDVNRTQTFLNKGVDVILSPSNYWYLDCGTGSWVSKGTNWCSPYKDWRTMYDFSPFNTTSNQRHKMDQAGRILGGEACVWSEAISSHTLDQKVWPRAAALAERLWTNPASNSRAAILRLIGHRNRLWKLGIDAESLQPEWCDNNGRKCTTS